MADDDARSGDGSSSRESPDAVVVDTDSGTARTTIVGAQPSAPSQRVKIPIGLERALQLAAGDGGFRRALLDAPLQACERQGITLTPNERATLSSLNPTMLRTLIARFDPNTHGSKRFSRLVATAVAVGLASGLTACEACSPAVTGSRPSPPPGQQQSVGEQEERQIPPGRIDAGAADGPGEDASAGEELEVEIQPRPTRGIRRGD